MADMNRQKEKMFDFPDYYEPVEEDFETALYEIHYPSKFASLSHGKILGTLVERDQTLLLWRYHLGR